MTSMDNTPDSPAKTPVGYTTQGGNFWTLITPEIWKVLHAVLHFSTTRRGVHYCAYKQHDSDQWWVSTHRVGLGPLHIGGGRYYRDLNDLAANCKAFAALPALLPLI